MSASAELVPFERQNNLRLLKDRMDAFGHQVLLLWDKGDNSVHLKVEGLDMVVPGDRANEAFDHTYPMLFTRLGERAVQFLVEPAEASVEAA